MRTNTHEPVRYCANCRTRLRRKTRANGELEGTRDFKTRRYCSTECAQAGLRRQFEGAKKCATCGELFPREVGMSRSRWATLQRCPACRPKYERRGELVPARPFQEALKRKMVELSAEYPGTELSTMAARTGRDIEYLRRFTKGNDSQHRPTATYSRRVVEDILHLLGIGFWEVYPEIEAAEDLPLEPDTWCAWCEDVVIPIKGQCPWCDEILVELGRAA